MRLCPDDFVLNALGQDLYEAWRRGSSWGRGGMWQKVVGVKGHVPRVMKRMVVWEWRSAHFTPLQEGCSDVTESKLICGNGDHVQ